MKLPQFFMLRRMRNAGTSNSPRDDAVSTHEALNGDHAIIEIARRLREYQAELVPAGENAPAGTP